MLMSISISVHFLLQVYAPLLPEEKWGPGKGELGDDGISCEGLGIELDHFGENHPWSIYGFLSVFYTLLKIFSTKKNIWKHFVEAGHQENREGKYIHGKSMTVYNSSMPGTVREKLSSRRFPDI